MFYVLWNGFIISKWNDILEQNLLPMKSSAGYFTINLYMFVCVYLFIYFSFFFIIILWHWFFFKWKETPKQNLQIEIYKVWTECIFLLFVWTMLLSWSGQLKANGLYLYRLSRRLILNKMVRLISRSGEVLSSNILPYWETWHFIIWSKQKRMILNTLVSDYK